MQKEKSQIRKLRNRKKEIDYKIFKDKINNLKEVWDKLEFNEKRSILITLIKKIIIKDNEIMIYYNSVA